MSDAKKSEPAAEPSSGVPADTVVPSSTSGRGMQLRLAAPTAPGAGSKPAQPGGGGTKSLRKPVPKWLALLLGVACILTVFGLWWLLTLGVSEERILPYNTIPSPKETFDPEQIRSLWFDSALTRNLIASLRRVVLGFALASAIGIPLGILAGCFPWCNAFLAPINVFGRNIPIAALIPLTFALFGLGELQKVMFIFIAAVAFVMMDTATAIADVSSRYIDTAFTLGASRRQTIMKVLVPLAMPRVFNSLRLLFGLAFGYIMLAELVTESGSAGGLGFIINTAQRRGVREPILLILMVIPAVALAIDRTLYMMQKSLFPYQYASSGLLHNAWRGLAHAGEDLKRVFFSSQPLDPAQQAALASAKAASTARPSNVS
ncbi:MAG TPA: ABC transporter permease [Lacipirellulaceae bacterium]|nr:ABC transporter permease [Lacipirellulaceae bacterium]